MRAFLSLTEVYRWLTKHPLSFIDDYQRKAWKRAGIVSPHLDPSFPFSGHFVAPKEIQDAIMALLALTGRIVRYPVISNSPLTTSYQEKITYPFLLGAWDRLEHTNQIKKGILLGRTVHLATAPSGKVYPEVFYFRMRQQYCIVFDANLILLYLIAANALAAVCYRPELVNGRQEMRVSSLGPFCLDIAVDELASHSQDIHPLADSLHNLLVFGNPVAAHFEMVPISQQGLVAQIIDTLYTYTLSHELSHIQQEDFRRKRRIGAAAEGPNDISMEERKADFFALSMLVNSHPSNENTLSAYIVTSIVFHIMGFIYRAVHLLHFRRDYGHLPSDLLRRIYFPEAALYPHPLTRLLSLRLGVREFSRPLPRALISWMRLLIRYLRTCGNSSPYRYWRQPARSLLYGMTL